VLEQNTIAVLLVDVYIGSCSSQPPEIFDPGRVQIDEVILSERRTHVKSITGTASNPFPGSFGNVLSGSSEGVDIDMLQSFLA